MWTVVLLILAITLSTLWPYEFSPQNHAQRTEDGLAFADRGIAYTDQPLRLPDPTNTPSFSLEIWIEAFPSDPGDGGVIISLDDGSHHPPLQIAQWKTGLGYLQWRKDENNKLVEHTPSVTSLLTPGRHHLVFTGDERQTILYLDGRATKIRSGYPVITAQPLQFARLVLGCRANGTKPWRGTVSRLAVYAKTLSAREVSIRYSRFESRLFDQDPADLDLATSYAFATDRPTDRQQATASIPPRSAPPFIIPPEFQPVRRNVLALPHSKQIGTRVFYQDTLLNIVGFMPLGLALGYHGRQRGWPGLKRFLAATAVGVVVSLAVELLQSIEPNRDSSLLDLACNTLGTAVGALAVTALWRGRLR